MGEFRLYLGVEVGGCCGQGRGHAWGDSRVSGWSGGYMAVTGFSAMDPDSADDWCSGL